MPVSQPGALWHSAHGLVVGHGACKRCLDPLTWVERSGAPRIAVDPDDRMHECARKIGVDQAASATPWSPWKHGYCANCGLYIGFLVTRGRVTQHQVPPRYRKTQRELCPGKSVLEMPPLEARWHYDDPRTPQRGGPRGNPREHASFSRTQGNWVDL